MTEVLLIIFVVLFIVTITWYAYEKHKFRLLYIQITEYIKEQGTVINANADTLKLFGTALDVFVDENRLRDARITLIMDALNLKSETTKKSDLSITKVEKPNFLGS